MRWPWAREQRRAIGTEDFFGRPTLRAGRITPERAARLASVFGAVRITTETLSSLPLHIVERLPDGTRARVEHAALSALGNPIMSQQCLLETLISRLELCGNSYAEIIRDAAGRPLEVWPLPPGIVYPKREGRTLFYEVHTKDGVQRVDAARILHLRFGVLSADGLTGTNPCELLAEDLTALEAARDCASKYLGGGMLPSGMLKHPAVLKDEARNRLKEDFHAAYHGTANAGRTILLEEGMEYQTISGNPETSQLLESREFGVRETARIWNLPASKLSDTARNSYASIEQDNLSFLQQSILPRARRIEAELNRALLGTTDRLSFRFELDGILRATTRDRYESYAKACGGPWATADEIRRLEDLSPIKGGNQLVTVPGAGFATDNSGGDPGAENTQ